MIAAEATGVATKGFAVHEAGTNFQPFNFVRRNPGPNDIAIDILYSGICHSDIHQARTNGPTLCPQNTRWYLATRSSDASPKSVMPLRSSRRATLPALGALLIHAGVCPAMQERR
jgi:hypothetical protein